MDLRESLRGITPPIVTPFDDDGSVDETALEAVLDHVLEGGVDAIFPNGTTGEFASLSHAERRRVLEVTVDRSAEYSVPVLAGAAATTVEETLAHVEDAADAGADAAVVVAPYFHTANDPAGNRAFFERVADESPLALLLYNIPACVGCEIAPETVEALAAHDSVIGIKDSSGDLAYLLSLVRRTPDDFLVLQGWDSLLVPALRMGADGGINALSNVFPDIYSEIVEKVREDRGRTLQAEAITPLFEVCETYGFAPVTKAGLVAEGALRSDAVRPPLVSVPAEGRVAVEEAVEGARSV